MTNTMLLVGFDPKSTAAPSGVQPGRTDKNGQVLDKTPGKSLDESFKKKLQELGGYAGAVAPSGGTVPNVNQETGMQGDAEGLEALDATPGIIEGLEQPVQTQLTAQMLAFAGENLAPEGEDAAAFAPEQGTETAETGDFARMQTANAGEAPVLTQDQILEAVGAYLDYADASGPVQEAPAAPLGESAQLTEAKVEPAPADMQPEGVEPRQAQPKEQFAPVQAEPAAESLERAELGKAEAVKEPAPKPVQEMKVLPEQNPVAITQEAPRAAQEAPSIAQTESVPAQEFAKENVLRIVESVQTHSAEGKHEFEIGLKPEFLGKIRIKLSMEHGNIHMLVKTDDPQVKQMMTDHASSLMNELREKGVTLFSMDVAYDNNQPAFDGGQQFQQSGGRRSAAARANFFAQTEPAADAAKDVAGLTAGKSTVEFFA